MASMLIFVLVATFITQGTAQGEWNMFEYLYFKCILIIIDTCTVAGELVLNPDSPVSICLSSSLEFKWRMLFWLDYHSCKTGL